MQGEAHAEVCSYKENFAVWLCEELFSISVTLCSEKLGSLLVKG
jgi:hypothetical protein